MDLLKASWLSRSVLLIGNGKKGQWKDVVFLFLSFGFSAAKWSYCLELHFGTDINVDYFNLGIRIT